MKNKGLEWRIKDKNEDFKTKIEEWRIRIKNKG